MNVILKIGKELGDSWREAEACCYLVDVHYDLKDFEKVIMNCNKYHNKVQQALLPRI